MQLLEEFISSLRVKHPAVAISFSAKVEGKPEDLELSAQPTTSRKTPPAKHSRSTKPPEKKRSPLTSGKFNNNNNYIYIYIIYTKNNNKRVKTLQLSMNTGPSGYEGGHPPVLNGTEDEPPCPYCHLGPCIISRAPSWLVGSSAPGLGNLAKRYTLYRKFWRDFVSWECGATPYI